MRLDMVLTTLAAFGADARLGLQSPCFRVFLVWSLGAAGFKIKSGEIIVEVTSSATVV